MDAAFVWKTYKKVVNKRLINALTRAIWVLDIDKFALQAFNCLAYNYIINGPLIANILLDLLEFYTPYKTIRKVNLWALYCRFVKVVFEKGIEIDLADDIICFKRLKEIPTSFFNNYYYRGSKLVLYFFYDYQKTIIVITFTAMLEGNIVFAHNHPNQKEKVQTPLKIELNISLIALMRFLSINKATEDAIQGGHPETDAKQNDVAIILFALFFP